jgi:hypothetical protein
MALRTARRLVVRGRPPGRAAGRTGVKPVAVVSDVFDCLEVHYGMPSELDERIAT